MLTCAWDDEMALVSTNMKDFEHYNTFSFYLVTRTNWSSGDAKWRWVSNCEGERMAVGHGLPLPCACTRRRAR